MASKNITILVSKIKASLHHAGSSLMDEFQQLQDWMEAGDEEASAHAEDWLNNHLAWQIPKESVDEDIKTIFMDLWKQVHCDLVHYLHRMDGYQKHFYIIILMRRILL